MVHKILCRLKKFMVSHELLMDDKLNYRYVKNVIPVLNVFVIILIYYSYSFYNTFRVYHLYLDIVADFHHVAEYLHQGLGHSVVNFAVGLLVIKLVEENVDNLNSADGEEDTVDRGCFHGLDVVEHERVRVVGKVVRVV